MASSSITSDNAATKVARALDAHNIHWEYEEDSEERQSADTNRLPDSIRNLIKNVTTTTAEQLTPDAKRITKLAKQVQDFPEQDALRALDNLLGFPDEVSIRDDEELLSSCRGIRRTYNRQYRKNAIPQPPLVDKRARLELQACGSLANPKPDVEYGYAKQLAHELGIYQIPSALFVSGRAPWLPWLIMEWKSQEMGGNMRQAMTQGLRDGAAAVACMHELLTYLNDPNEAGNVHRIADSAIFVGTCDSMQFKIRIHWRWVKDDGECSWEATEVVRGDLDRWKDMRQVRKILVNIKDWAMGDRAKMIQEKITKWQSRLAAQESQQDGRSNAASKGKDRTPPTPPQSDKDAKQLRN